MRVAIIGSRFKIPDITTAEEKSRLARRNARVQAEVERYVAQLPPGTIVVSGGAQGVDSWAAAAARARGLEVEEIRPDWQGLGKRAGFLRNRQIIDRCESATAFWDGTSSGTRSSLFLAKAAGKATEIFLFNDDGLLV